SRKEFTAAAQGRKGIRMSFIDEAAPGEEHEPQVAEGAGTAGAAAPGPVPARLGGAPPGRGGGARPRGGRGGPPWRRPPAPGVPAPRAGVAPDGRLTPGRGGDAPAAPRLVLALHKPRGVVTTRSDERGRRTVYDLLPPGLSWVFPAGRLDADSEGLLILTNDA